MTPFNKKQRIEKYFINRKSCLIYLEKECENINEVLKFMRFEIKHNKKKFRSVIRKETLIFVESNIESKDLYSIRQLYPMAQYDLIFHNDKFELDFNKKRYFKEL